MTDNSCYPELVDKWNHARHEAVRWKRRVAILTRRLRQARADGVEVRRARIAEIDKRFVYELTQMLLS